MRFCFFDINMNEKYFRIFLLLLVILVVIMLKVYSRIFEGFNFKAANFKIILKETTKIISQYEPKIFCVIMTSPKNFENKVINI